jgi:HAD superfamily hydrolase (TIGR01509 family)
MPAPRAMFFDMDGTLTEPMLDFPRIKAEMGIGPGPILESLAELDELRRRQAEAVLLRHERLAAENSRLNAGCRELLAWLAERSIATALITRNSRLSVETVIRRHGLEIAVRITREDGPFKPSPFPLELACRRLRMNCGEVWMVGDGQYDIEAANAAGMRSVWISHRRQKAFEAEPWMIVENLTELADVLKRS